MPPVLQKTEEGECFLILAPIGKDSSLLAAALSDAGFHSQQVPTIRALRDHLGESIDHFGGVILAEEALTRDDVSSLLDILNKQPPWSDLPFILLNKKTDDSRAIRLILEALAPSNITLLERPFSSVTFLSTVRTALRTRRKQYELKHLLEEKERSLAEIRRSNEELAQFAYVASHDLKEPLRVVRTHLQFVQKLLGNQLSERPREHMQFAMEASSRMYDLINDLLAYAKVGVSGEKTERVATNEAVSEVLEALGASIKEAGAEIQLIPLPAVHAVPTQVKQLFQNLISNAVKYRANRPLKVSISAEPNGTFAIFSVRDNGIGFDPQYSKKVFELFQRLHTRSEYPGTGIGLSICKKIVEQHGGQIWAESAPGEGTVFKFSLPLEQEGAST